MNTAEFGEYIAIMNSATNECIKYIRARIRFYRMLPAVKYCGNWERVYYVDGAYELWV